MINYDFLSDLKVKLDENEVTLDDLKKVVNGLSVYPIKIEDSTLPSFKKMLKKIRVLAEERLEFSDQINKSVKEGFIAVIKAKENDIKTCQIFFDRISKKEEKEEPKNLFTIVRSYPASTNSLSSTISPHSSVASLSNNSSITFSSSLTSSSSHPSALSIHPSSSSNPALSKNDGLSIVCKPRDLSLRNKPDALFEANIEDLQAISTALASVPKLNETIQRQIENSLDVFKIENLQYYDDVKISALREQLGQLSEEFNNKPNSRLYSSLYHKRIMALCVKLEAISEAREEEKIKIAEIKKEREDSLTSLCDVLKINKTTTSSSALISFQETAYLQDKLEQIRQSIDKGMSKQTLDLQLVDQAFLLVAQEYTQEGDSKNLENGYQQLKFIMVQLINISHQKDAKNNFLLEPAKFEEYQRKFNELAKRVPLAISSLNNTKILTPAPARPVKQNDFSSKKESLEKIVRELKPLSSERKNLGCELIERFFLIAYSIDFETYSNGELETIKFNLSCIEGFAQTFKSSYDVAYAQNLIKVIVALQKTANRKVLEPKDENNLYLAKEYIDFLQSNIQNFDRLKSHEKMALYQALQDLCAIIASIIGEEGDLLRVYLSQMADKILLTSENRDLDFIEAKIMSELFAINDITLPPMFSELSLLSEEEQKTLSKSDLEAKSLVYKRKLFEDMKLAKMEAREGNNKPRQKLIRKFHWDKELAIDLEWFIKEGYGSPTAEERAKISTFMNEFFKPQT